jgi:hypothetical protein
VTTLPPYDNKDYRYGHSDADRRQGLARVAELLGLASVHDQSGLLYDLRFYSGGIGVLDRLAVTMPANAAVWADVMKARPVKAPEDIIAGDRLAAEGFLLLARRDDTGLDARAAAAAFINREKREFQASCRPSDRILFSPESDGNDWFALWGTDDLLHCLAFSQG